MHAAACSSHAASGDTETTRTPGCPRDSAGARTHAAPGRAAPAGARRNSDTAPRTACCRNSSAMSPPNSSPLKRVNLRAPGREARGPTIEGSEADRMCTAVRPLSLRAASTGGVPARQGRQAAATVTCAMHAKERFAFGARGEVEEGAVAQGGRRTGRCIGRRRPAPGRPGRAPSTGRPRSPRAGSAAGPGPAGLFAGTPLVTIPALPPTASEWMARKQADRALRAQLLSGLTSVLLRQRSPACQAGRRHAALWQSCRQLCLSGNSGVGGRQRGRAPAAKWNIYPQMSTIGSATPTMSSGWPPATAWTSPVRAQASRTWTPVTWPSAREHRPERLQPTTNSM